MRVWALASCSGLLALAACSADQSSSPNPSAAPLDGEDTADIQAQPGLTATASSPMARPEVRPRQVIQGGYRLSLSSGKPAATTASSSKAVPQAAELRQRLARLRNQQGSRLAPSTPVVTAPQPSTLAQPNLSGASPVKPTVEQESPAFNPIQSPSFSPQAIAALPTPPRPTPSAPQASTPASAPDPGGAASASVARNYPVAPLRHQSYSARSQQPAPVLTVARTPTELPATARLHGDTLTAQQPESLTPGETSASQVAIVEGNTSPKPNSSEASAAATDAPTPAIAIRSESSTTDAPTPAIAIRSESSAPAPGAAGGHQSSGPVALTPVVQPTVGLETNGESHQSQAVSAAVASDPVNQAPGLWESARAEAAIAPPESLPLNPPSPRPNFVRPQLTESAAETDDSTAGDNIPEVSAIPERTTARIAAPTPQTTIPNPESRPPETTTLGETSAAPELHHQSQISPAAVRLIPTASNPSKDLPIAYCLLPSGQPVPATLEAQGSSASLPQFSPANQADPSLDLASTLSKENPIAPCVETPSSTSELTTIPLTPTLDAPSQP
ncbi:hypothetical protein VB780_01435 [Leptolyngbya sp. CCNP1308]|uniref:hypothetical protein n=1 Tax=Leptolyngbya sp. CCNP1308 TaxID=3110255 RepID=UPI002B1F340A|nr:hypothetical protein [Leptolyngbya sp. CCNP1308]MEA5447212.1 hypothetical protein [Leptolyngbya sp. CCNP1308]